MSTKVNCRLDPNGPAAENLAWVAGKYGYEVFSTEEGILQIIRVGYTTPSRTLVVDEIAKMQKSQEGLDILNRLMYRLSRKDRQGDATT